MKDLQVIEIKGQRVLTTRQVAEMYDTTVEKIRWNYKYNKKKYITGKHFVLIEGKELRELKRECDFQTLFKQAKSVCLWTEKGALLHAKSINTDKAWEAYDYLVDFYFRAKEQPRQQAPEAAGEPVVNIPDDMKAQQRIREARKYLQAIDAELDMINRYISQESFDHHKAVLMDMEATLMTKLLDIAVNKPQIIFKKL